MKLNPYFFIVALCFVYRSFYGVRIPEEASGGEGTPARPRKVQAEEMLVGKE